MPGITNPDEEYFKDGLWAWDPAGAKWLKLIIDPLTNQLSVAVNNDAEIHQTTPADLTPGICGWDGSAWRKLPLVWGYSSRWNQQIKEYNASSGEDSLVTATVPAGEVWVLQNASVQWSGTSCVLLELQANHGVLGTRLYVQRTPVSGQWELWRGNLVLAAGDYVQAYFWGLTALDNLLLDVSGYKMKIAE